MNENTPETTHKQKYESKLRDWSNQIVFRIGVYMVLMALALGQLAITTKLATEGVLTGSEQTFEFVYSSLLLLLTGLLFRDVSRGISYQAIRVFGKHRLFAVVGVGIAVLFGVNWADPQMLTGEHAETYVMLAWALAILIGLEPLEGAIFERDADRVRSVLPGVETDG